MYEATKPEREKETIPWGSFETQQNCKKNSWPFFPYPSIERAFSQPIVTIKKEWRREIWNYDQMRGHHQQVRASVIAIFAKM